MSVKLCNINQSGIMCAIIIDKKISKFGHSIKFTFTYKGNRAHKKSNYYCSSLKEWCDLCNSDELTEYEANLKNKIFKFFEKHTSVIENLIENNKFSFDNLEKELNNDSTANIFDFFNEKIKSTENKSTADTYKYSKNALLKFINGKSPSDRKLTNEQRKLDNIFLKNELQFSEITPIFLEKFENWLIVNGNTINTVSMYVKCVQAMFNVAVDKGVVSENKHPFGEKFYNRPGTFSKK